MELIESPLIAKLKGGPLDGDEFELIPNGSVLPPMRLSYISRAIIDGVEQGCWINYINEQVSEWTHEELIYDYKGKEKLE